MSVDACQHADLGGSPHGERYLWGDLMTDLIPNLLACLSSQVQPRDLHYLCVMRIEVWKTQPSPHHFLYVMRIEVWRAQRSPHQLVPQKEWDPQSDLADLINQPGPSRHTHAYIHSPSNRSLPGAVGAQESSSRKGGEMLGQCPCSCARARSRSIAYCLASYLELALQEEWHQLFLADRPFFRVREACHLDARCAAQAIWQVLPTKTSAIIDNISPSTQISPKAIFCLQIRAALKRQELGQQLTKVSHPVAWYQIMHAKPTRTCRSAPFSPWQLAVRLGPSTPRSSWGRGRLSLRLCRLAASAPSQWSAVYCLGSRRSSHDHRGCIRNLERLDKLKRG